METKKALAPKGTVLLTPLQHQETIDALRAEAAGFTEEAKVRLADAKALQESYKSTHKRLWDLIGEIHSDKLDLDRMELRIVDVEGAPAVLVVEEESPTAVSLLERLFGGAVPRCPAECGCETLDDVDNEYPDLRDEPDLDEGLLDESIELTYHHDGHGLQERCLVAAVDEPHPVNGAHHLYELGRKITKAEAETLGEFEVVGVEDGDFVISCGRVDFQRGPRDVEGSTPGTLDEALVSILLHRVETFQVGCCPCPENEEKIGLLRRFLALSKQRADDRAERNVLGTNEK